MASGPTRQSIELKEGQKRFLRRKVEEIRKLVPIEKRDKVSETLVIQGMLDLWMAVEKDGIHEKRAHKKSEGR